MSEAQSKSEPNYLISPCPKGGFAIYTVGSNTPVAAFTTIKEAGEFVSPTQAPPKPRKKRPAAAPRGANGAGQSTGQPAD